MVTEGSVLAASGSLVVNCGAYASSDIRVWNGDTEWIPQLVVGNTQYYDVSSDGDYSVRHSDGRILLTFRVTIPQDFTIKYILNNNTANPLEPGAVLTEGTYRQRDTRSKQNPYEVWVLSEDNDITSLPLSSTNRTTISSGQKSSEYGAKYLRIIVDLTNSVIGQPLMVYVGNVLVAYITEITA